MHVFQFFLSIPFLAFKFIAQIYRMRIYFPIYCVFIKLISARKYQPFHSCTYTKLSTILCNDSLWRLYIPLFLTLYNTYSYFCVHYIRLLNLYRLGFKKQPIYVIKFCTTKHQFIWQKIDLFMYLIKIYRCIYSTWKVHRIVAMYLWFVYNFIFYFIRTINVISVCFNSNFKNNRKKIQI